jgi:Uma2 family endonuclease
MTAAISLSPPKRKATIPRFVSIEEYFRLEEKSLYKNEYHNGIILKMAGAKLPHNQIASQVITLFNNYGYDNNLDFIVSNSDTKIQIEAYNKFVYPDAVVICEKPDYYEGREDTITNPRVIVEVLSKTTKDHDKTIKFDMYRTLPSFKEYVLIHQEIKRVSVYSKQPNNVWILTDYDGDDAVAIVHNLHECPLPLKRLYHKMNEGK